MTADFLAKVATEDTPECIGCAFSSYQEEGNFCRRYPPTLKGFPKIKDDDWCGEWKDFEKCPKE